VLQIGDKGQGVVVRSVSSPGHIVRSSSSRAEVFAQEERWRRRIEQAESFLSGALSPTGPWRGTSEAEEVQCSTAGGTMPPNPADCSIGEGSGSACLEPVALAKYRDDLRRDSLRYYMQGHLGQSRSVNRFGLLDKLAAEHRERRDSAWEAILCHGHAPVPFNPETWTGASP
jgi:hypothetical protein